MSSPATTLFATPPSMGMGVKSPKQKISTSSTGAQAVDLVTGKTTVHYFFDPTLTIQESPSCIDSSFRGNSLRRNNSAAASVDSNGSTDDSLVFSSNHLFMPCIIIKPLDDETAVNGNSAHQLPTERPILVKTLDGVLHKIRDSNRLIPLTSPDDYVGISDVLHLAHITEASLLHTLRLRYERGEIYTNAGPILISINPYREITLGRGESIYSEKQMLLYRSNRVNGSFQDNDDIPPHLFQVADRAYSALMQSAQQIIEPFLEEEDSILAMDTSSHGDPIRNQSIIISGESGAGKTEATKIIMQYLARLPGGPKGPNGRTTAALEDRVLSSNPLLESFGNAQTLRNDNSSRFGKFIHIHFNTVSGSITGASISNYLLEKTRITAQVDGERNYHFFYQLLAGASEEILQQLELDGGESSFRYLGNRELKHDRDTSDFARTKNCLEQIGLTESEQIAVFQIAAAVLHLGNVTFVEVDTTEADDKRAPGDTAKISETTKRSFFAACKLLGLEPVKVEEAILTKLITVGGKTIQKPQSVALAADKRDALAKMAYSSLFLWLVQRVNQTLSTELLSSGDIDGSNHSPDGFIGVLDIYGFECFELNGYEQLLINYCNEKLQRHFNRNLFEVEQDLYSTEGVDWTYIKFNDNRLCLELIEGGRGTVGIINTLDDAWGGMGTASEKDVKFVSQLRKLYGLSAGLTSQKTRDLSESGHKHFITPKFGNDRQFVIIHYAGEVRYTADGFVEKNMETLSNEVKDLGDESTICSCREVFRCCLSDQDIAASNSCNRRSSIRGVSVASQFRSCLQSLVDDLERTQPHYIRCIKPNVSKAPDSFSSREVLKQLRYSGMMEAIRIRREGYALREEHGSFYNRFRVLLFPEDEALGVKEMVKVLSKRLKVTDADWQIGHSKIFLRRELALKLDRLAKLRVYAAARTVGRFGRQVAERRAITLLVVWARFRLRISKQYRMNQAATKINVCCRGHLDRRRCQALKNGIILDRAASKINASCRSHVQCIRFQALRRSVIIIQALQRRKGAALRVRRIRDPFWDMGVKELTQLHDAEQRRLEDAVRTRDFKLATEIELKVVSLIKAIEAKTPLTRLVVEKRITEVQKEIEDAVTRKDYHQCASLQEKLDSLLQQRAVFPTVEELQVFLQEAESEVAKAVERRDFARAASGQAAVDEAKQRLADALAAEREDKDSASSSQDEEFQDCITDIASRVDLEADIENLTSRIKEAIQAHDFSLASSLQKNLEERENLRPFFPTVTELAKELEMLHQQLAEVVGKKDFTTAATLSDRIDKLEDKLSREKGDNEPKPAILLPNGELKIFESRADLESAITKYTNLVAGAVASKDFRQAQVFQDATDQMESLRKLLPSISELEALLSEKWANLESATSSMQVLEVHRIKLEILSLEMKLDLEWKVRPDRTSDIEQKQQGSTQEQDVITLVESMVNKDGKSINSVSATRVKSKSLVSVPVKFFGASPDVRKESDPASLAPRNFTTLSTLHSVAGHRDHNEGCNSSKASPCLKATKMPFDKDDDRSIQSAPVARNQSKTVIVGSITVTPQVVAPTTPKESNDITKATSSRSLLPFSTTQPSATDRNGKKCFPMSQQPTRATVKNLNFKDDRSIQSAPVSKMRPKIRVPPTNVITRNGRTQPPSGSTKLVLSLRPARAVLVGSNDSVLEVTKSITAKRGTAAVVTRSQGGFDGIVTDTDITLRVVAPNLPPSTTIVSNVMTAVPFYVSTSDSAMEALTTMVENHIRHLPVVDEMGSIVGLLDISKCLNVVIARLERAQGRGNRAAADAIHQAFTLRGSKGTRNGAAMQGHLGPLMVRAFGNQTSPPLREILAIKPNTIVQPNANLREVGLLMAESRKAALIVEDGRLVGIFGFKDMMTRVVADELPLDDTKVSTVMTHNPESVLPSMTVLEALQTMYDNNFLTLPVCEEDGSVVGLVDVMDVIHGCGGAEDWRSFFQSAMELDDQSESGSVSSRGSVNSRGSVGHSSSRRSPPKDQKDRPVSKLRPRQPLLLSSEETVLRVAQLMTSNRGDAVLIVDGSGGLDGIFTDTDVTRRVVAKHVDPASTKVSRVMTSKPLCVAMSDSATDALSTMVENHIRHLPIIDDQGKVVGLLDIANCLQDAITRLERAKEISGSGIDMAQLAASLHGVSAPHAAALQAVLGPLMAQAFGNRSIASIRGLLAARPSTIVGPDMNLLQVGILMAETRKAALIVENGHLIGIFGFKDMMTRAVAKELPLADIPVSRVMTPNPESVSPNISVLEALQTMHDNNFLTLPVCEDNGTVVGIVDVIDVIYGCGGAEGWRSIFSSALEHDCESVSSSACRGRVIAPVSSWSAKPHPEMETLVSSAGAIPTILEIDGDDNDVFSPKDKERRGSTSISPISAEGPMTIFEVTDHHRNTHRIRADVKVDIVKDSLAKKVALGKDEFHILFVDNEGDSVVISTDDDLHEAVKMGQSSGGDVVKLSMSFVKHKNGGVGGILGLFRHKHRKAPSFKFSRS